MFGIFVWFWYQDGGLIKKVWECFSLCNFLKEFEERCYLFSEYLMKFACEII